LARLGSTRPLREIMKAKDDPRDPLRLMDQVAAWQVGNVLIGTPPPDNGVHNRSPSDRHQLRLPRRLVDWLRRPHHDRGLGGASRRRAVQVSRRRTAAAPILFDAFARTKLPRLPKPKGRCWRAMRNLLPLRRFRPVGTGPDWRRAGRTSSFH
jgi:penicillin-binding protein 1C